MGVEATKRLAVACLLAGALACAKNTEKVDEATDAAQDTTSTQAPLQATAGWSGTPRTSTTVRPLRWTPS